MSAWIWVVIVVAVIAIIAIAVWAMLRKKRTENLRGQFGPEYDRMADAGGRKQAEAELEDRRRRRESLQIRPLTPEARDRYRARWEEVQARFVDLPAGAVRDADQLVQQVLRERGYPLESFDDAASTVSVDHPQVVQNYREAHAVSLAEERGEASTEDLRRAVVAYRSLFDVLLADGTDTTDTTDTGSADGRGSSRAS